MSNLGIGIGASPSFGQAGFGSVLSTAAAVWRMRAQASGDAAWLDALSHGMHGWFGGVKKAVIADTTSGDRGLILPGIAGNYGSVPAAGLDVLADLDVQVWARPGDWTPTAEYAFVSKWLAAGNQRGWFLYLQDSGVLSLYFSVDGTATVQVDSTAATGVADGTAQWVRATRNSTTGDVIFYLGGATVTPTWVKLGNTVSAATGAIFANSALVNVGAYSAGVGNPFAGTIYRAIIKDGIGGTTVLDVDFTTQPQGTRTFTCTTGQVVTVNTAGTSTAEPTQLFHGGTTHLWLPGTTGNSASTPDAAALDIVGDIDLRAKIALADWTPAANMDLIAKLLGSGDQRSYVIRVVATTGILSLVWYTLGTNVSVVTANSTAAPTVVDGATLWVRATLDVNNGSGAYEVKFWTSTDGSTWTQLGNTVSPGGTTSIFAGTADLYIGSQYTNNPMLGKVYQAQIYDGIAGTKVLDIDFTQDALYNATQTTLTAVTGQVVTINRSATGLQSFVVTENVVLGDKVDDKVSWDDNPLLDFSDTEDLTLVLRGRWFGTPASTSVLAGKKSGILAANAGYQLLTDTSKRLLAQVSDGTDLVASTSAAMAEGAHDIRALRLKRTGATVTSTVNDVVSASGDAAAVGSLANDVEFRIFAGGAGADFSRGGIYDVLLFRYALTDQQLVQLRRELL
jgi:hypothetical protein